MKIKKDQVFYKPQNNVLVKISNQTKVIVETNTMVSNKVRDRIKSSIWDRIWDRIWDEYDVQTKAG